jgi:hypothetical protein
MVVAAGRGVTGVSAIVGTIAATPVTNREQLGPALER